MEHWTHTFPYWDEDENAGGQTGKTSTYTGIRYICYYAQKEGNQ